MAETYRFRPRDQFRLRLGVDFTAWIYLFNRAVDDDEFTILYPLTRREQEPLSPSQNDVLLPDRVWLSMDDSPEDEHLVLVVSSEPWSGYRTGRETVPYGELEAALSEAEDRFDTLSWQRSEVGDRVRLRVAETGEPVTMVLRLLEGNAP